MLLTNNYPRKAALKAESKSDRKFAFTTAGKNVKNMKQMTSSDPYAEQLGSYHSIEAGISTRNPTKYCDFIGFHAKYADPKSKLRYFSQE